MKKLFLASNGRCILEKGLEMLIGPNKPLRLAHVTTAQKGVDNKEYIKNHQKKLTELGYNFEELDIEGKNEIKLREILQNKDAVWVDGGNTFYLLKAVKETGFDRVIRDLIGKGLIYFGSSAGSLIVCPTIETSLWKISEKDIKNNYGLKDLTGLNLVPFLLRVHYKPEQKNLLEEKVKEIKYPIRILQDNQAFLVQGDDIKLVGEGEEIRLY